MKENTGLRKTTLAALFLAIGLILPQLEKCFVQCIYRYCYAVMSADGHTD